MGNPLRNIGLKRLIQKIKELTDGIIDPVNQALAEARQAAADASASAAEARSVVAGNTFVIVDKDDDNKTYSIGLSIENSHVVAEFNEMTE